MNPPCPNQSSPFRSQQIDFGAARPANRPNPGDAASAVAPHSPVASAPTSHSPLSATPASSTSSVSSASAPSGASPSSGDNTPVSNLSSNSSSPAPSATTNQSNHTMSTAATTTAIDNAKTSNVTSSASSVTSAKPADSASSATPDTASSAGSAGSNSSRPAAVTSAKAAINALYAKQSNTAHPPIVTSAREAVNAAAKQATVQHTKSAANLHHGSIQRSMESTRTSASALLRRADDEVKVDSFASSLDPLSKARTQPVSSEKRPEREVPIVRTSLKLGSAARPKPAPVVLPPHARMAQVARPVDSPDDADSAGKFAKLLRRSHRDGQIVTSNELRRGAKAKALTSGKSADTSDEHALTVKIVPSNPSKTRAKVSATRDPQMVAGARRVSKIPKAEARGLSTKAETAAALGMVTAHSARFRTKPKGFSSATPAALPVDNSYVMATPPKLTPKPRDVAPDSLGVIESYHPEPTTATVGDKAPTGTLKAQSVASGHGGASSVLPETPGIKADNTANYSFLKPKTAPEHNRYAMGGESPFLKSVNVEKRPLSSTPDKFNPHVERRTVINYAEPTHAVTKSSRKNHYAKKSASPTPAPAPVRPTVIVPSNRRSKAPLVFLMFITIVLGTAVGAAVYLCFFQ